MLLRSASDGGRERVGDRGAPQVVPLDPQDQAGRGDVEPAVTSVTEWFDQPRKATTVPRVRGIGAVSTEAPTSRSSP